MPPDGLTLRALEPTDAQIAILTDLLHRAYAPLAARGMRYLATWQDEDTTRNRIEEGECLVAELDGRIVGVITWEVPGRGGDVPWYERPDVGKFQQFCVEPALQRTGIASLLLEEAERRARAAGAEEFACDTAEPAHDLIEWYERRGYRIVGKADWRPTTNYESVILSKTL